MTSIIQQISKNNSSQLNFYSSPATSTPVVPVAQSSEVSKNPGTAGIKEHPYFNSKTIAGSLIGLAVISGGVWKIASRVKSGSASSRLDPAELKNNINYTKEYIADLINVLKPAYASKRQKIIKKMNTFGEFDSKISFKDDKELGVILSNYLSKYEEISSKTQGVIEQNHAIIRQKLGELAQNPEWNELRKIRKTLIRSIDNAQSTDEIKITNEKIVLVNDLLINRVNPEKAINYESFSGISDRQAFDIVRKNFSSYEEFSKELNSIKNRDVLFNFEDVSDRFTHKAPLTLADIFPNEADVIAENKKLVLDAFNDYTAAQNMYNKLRAEIKSLTQEFMGLDEVKKLRELNSQLRKYKAELSKYQAA